MLSYEEAFEKMMAQAAAPRTGKVPVGDALGRVLAADAASLVDLPPFSNSAMDGYAVRSEDTAGASGASPVTLTVKGESAAGHPFGGAVEAGEAVLISTGAMVPRGANAVVMVEHTRAKSKAEVMVKQPAGAGDHIRVKSEDFRRGEIIRRRGQVLGPAELALLAGGGLGEIPVFESRSIAVCATGSELVEPGKALAEGQIYESSALLLRSLVRESAPASVLPGGTATDDVERIGAMVGAAVEQADVVAVCGGVSVGEHDYVKEIFNTLGIEEIFWKVRIKPGKPVFFGAHPRGWVFGIPGNPVSVLSAFVLFVEPFLRAVSGCTDCLPLTTRAKLTTLVRKKGPRRVFVTSRVFPSGRELLVRPITGQGSGMLHSMRGANGFLVIPEEQAFIEGGQDADVMLFPSFRNAAFFEET